MSAAARGDTPPREREFTNSNESEEMADSHDVKPHQQTYGSFIAMLKWSIPLIAVIVLVVILLIS